MRRKRINDPLLCGFNLVIKELNGQICVDCRRRSVSIRCPSRGHISKTKQGRPIVTIEYYQEVGTADFIAVFRSPPPPRDGATPSFSGKHDQPVTSV